MLKNNLSKQFIFEFIFKFFSANQLRAFNRYPNRTKRS